MLFDPYLKTISGSSSGWLSRTNPTGSHEVEGSISGLAQWVKAGVAMSCGVGQRRGWDPRDPGSDPALLQLWHRSAAVVPLAWKPPYVAGAALKRQNK